MVSSSERVSLVSFNGLSNTCGSDKLSTITPWVECMKIQKGEKVEYDPLIIGFTCQRSADHIAPEISRLYHTIIAGKSDTLLNPKPGFCGPDEVTMHCGNFRGALTECACDTLNRLKYPDLRLIFENYVIQAADRICHSSPKPTQLNIAIFASGGLHGEQVLLFRLVEKIKSIFVGTINLFLMDWQYKNNIHQAGTFICRPLPSTPFDWDNFIGKRKDLYQFLNELALCLPSTIKVSGWVFGDANDYIRKVGLDSAFRHDLLIGADIDGENILFGRIKQATYRIQKEPGILLRRKPEIDTPELCDVPASTGTCDCISLIVEQVRSATTPTSRFVRQSTPTRTSSPMSNAFSSPMSGVSPSLANRSISPAIMGNTSYSSPAFSSPMPSTFSSPMSGVSSGLANRSISPAIMGNTSYSSPAFSSPMPSTFSSPMSGVSSGLANRSISPAIMGNTSYSSPVFSSPMSNAFSSPMSGVSSGLANRSISPAIMGNTSYSSPAFSSPMPNTFSSPMSGVSSGLASRSVSPAIMGNTSYSSPAFSSPAPLNFSVRPIPSAVGATASSTVTQVIQGHHAISR